MNISYMLVRDICQCKQKVCLQNQLAFGERTWISLQNNTWLPHHRQPDNLKKAPLALTINSTNFDFGAAPEPTVHIISISNIQG